MKLTLETYKKKYSVETEYDDLSLEEYFDLFKGMLVAATFPENGIHQHIIEWAEQLKEEQS